MVKSATSKKTKTPVTSKKKDVGSSDKKIKRVLITQPKPESEKSPYFELARKFDVQLDFHPFIHVEGIPAKDFRKQKVNINDYTAVIFNSRNAIDHFFRLADELRVKISPEMKYFCITEAISLYLQKFILYRKRKIFYGEDGTVQSMLDVIAKHKTKEKYFVPVNDICRAETLECLQSNELEYGEALLYKTVCADVKDVIEQHHDMIVFFTPGGIRSLFENKPDYEQNGTYIAAFGPITTKAVEDAGLTLHLKAPLPGAPSMVAAMDMFLTDHFKKK